MAINTICKDTDMAAADMDPKVSQATKHATVHDKLQCLAWNDSANSCARDAKAD